jgi:hypothetical protein
MSTWIKEKATIDDLIIRRSLVSFHTLHNRLRRGLLLLLLLLLLL